VSMDGSFFVVAMMQAKDCRKLMKFAVVFDRLNV